MQMTTVSNLCEFNFPANKTTASVVLMIENNQDFMVSIDAESLRTGVKPGDIDRANITVVNSKYKV